MRTWFKRVLLNILLGVWFLGALHLAAQSIDEWAPIRRVTGYGDTNPNGSQVDVPTLVADQNGVVHAFGSQWFGGVRAVVYSQWTLEHGWTIPVDILLPPIKSQANVTSVFLDRTGMLHLIFFAGDAATGIRIYYSKALATDAGRASAWTVPVAVGRDVMPPSTATLRGAGDDYLVIVYSGKSEGPGLYSMYSSDAGNTWTESEALFLTYSGIRPLSALNLYIDSERNLHAVWTVNNAQGNGDAVYYASLQSNMPRWGEPMLIAEAIGYEADWASVILYESELFIIYQNGGPATRWMRRSDDGGQTWTEPILLFPYVGEYGPAKLVVDKRNRLHMVLGNRSSDENHGMWHSVWQSDHWSALEPIVNGPVSKTPGEGFDPHFPHVAITQDNVLLAVWKNDHGFNGVWYSYLVLDGNQPVTSPSSETPVVADAEATEAGSGLAPVQLPPVAPSTVPSESPPISQVDSLSSAREESNFTSPIIVGLVPVALLIVGVLSTRKWRQLSS
jgi:hypothetical protein